MAPIPPHIFREYDIRGLVDVDLHPEGVALIARGWARRLREGGGRRVVVGRDCRLSSPLFRDAFVHGLNESGIDVVDLGVVPTPHVYFAAHVLDGIDGMAMITASHNPAPYNGLKLGVGRHSLFGEELQELRRTIEAGGFPAGEGRTTKLEIGERYLRHAAETLRFGERPLRVVVDAGNGMGGPTAKALYERLGVRVEGLYLEPDGTFPNHHPDPAQEKNLEELRRRVLESGADLGLAFDGDADRVTAIDERGEILWGDRLLIPFIRTVLAEEPGTAVVGEVKCSRTMFEEIEKRGGKPVMWKAGHSLIKAKMREVDASLGGEMSGHIFFRNRWFGFDDGVYAGARLLELLSRDDRPLSAHFADVPKTFASPEIRRDARTEERKFALVRAATEHFRASGAKVIDVDGVRVEFEDGWGLVRASNTQPILVLRFEARTKQRMDEIRALVEGTLSQLEAKME